MSMLADPKKKPSWVLNPRASEWSKDQNKLGQKMLEKMGWSVGKGLGAKEQGPVEAIRIAYKGDCRGLGSARKKEQEDWLQQQESFQSLLDGLNGTNDRSVKVKSLEEKSKTTRTKIHYHKFARGKDISRYSEKDLSCIVGSGFMPLKFPDVDTTPDIDGVIVSGSKTNGSACLEPDAKDNCPSSEKSMNRQRSRTGRELKPSAKIVALSEEGAQSMTKKMKTKEKPGEIGLVSQSQPESESKPSAKVATCSGQMISPPKKKKIKGKVAESTTQVSESAAKSKEHKDQEHSRSGRAYKPTVKATTNLEEMPPSPRKKKTKDVSTKSNIDESEAASGNAVKSGGEPARSRRELKSSANNKATLSERSPSLNKKKPKSTKLISESEADSETAFEPDEDSMHSRSRREYKPTAKALENLVERLASPPNKRSIDKAAKSKLECGAGSETMVKPDEECTYLRSRRERKPTAKALASLNERSPSPRRKMKENAPVVHSALGSSEEPAVDHAHSRSGREYKPSAKTMESLEEKWPSKIANKNAKQKRSKQPSTDSSSLAPTRKQKTISDCFDESPPKALHNTSSKTKSSKNTSEDESVAQVDLPTRQSPRKRLPPSESLYDIHDETEQVKPKKSKKKGQIEEDSEPTSMKSRNVAKVNVLEQSRSPKKKKKALGTGNPAVTKKKINEDTESNEPYTKEYLKMRSKGAKEEVVEMNEAPKVIRKNKKKEKGTEGSDEPSSSNVGEPVNNSENSVDVEQYTGLNNEGRKSKRKKKGKVANGPTGTSMQDVASEREEPSARVAKKEKKRKAERVDQEVPETGNKMRDDAGEPPSKTKKHKKTRNVTAGEPDENPETDQPKTTKSKKKQERLAGKVDLLEPSESQETSISGKQDSDDTEELGSINSQSSLIYEMIGNTASTMSVGSTPEELKKYHILVSDSEDDD